MPHHRRFFTANKAWMKSIAALTATFAMAATELVPAVDAAGDQDEIVVYSVGKKVADFPEDNDFSTPEAAYATINRLCADGTGDWRAVSSKRVNKEVPLGDFKMEPVSAEVAHRFRTAEILEVRIYRGEYAQVTARLDNVRHPIDTRSFAWEGGRWLNEGNDRYATVEEAAAKFDQLIRRRNDLAQIKPRPPVADPETALAPYVEYLRAHGQPPQDYVLEALAEHRLVVIGEIHHRPTYWALNSQVVQDPRFARTTGTIYLELPMHAQSLVDEFLAAETLDPAPVIAMLRDNLWTGWPDQAMLDFFIAVWQTNRGLDQDQRIRIVLVDMKRPWRELVREGNLKKYDTDRNKLMADNILSDMERQADPRHALFIVGYAHIETLRLAGAEQPFANAGRHLREQLGTEMFIIVQHGPVITNMGRVSGRTCLGLFDEAFAVNGHAAVAFSLRDSPFGRQRYDLNGDRCDSSMSLFAEAFDGYLYLGPMEEEVFSPLIPGFYTDEFVQELDARYQLLAGKGLAEGIGLPRGDAQSFEKWMNRSWGQPRDWRHQLGPVTAWHQGDHAVKPLIWSDQPAPPTVDADPTTRTGMIRLVEDFFQHNFRDITALKTLEWGPVTTDANGNSSITYKFEATIWNGEKKEMRMEFTFTPNGGVVSVEDKSE